MRLPRPIDAATQARVSAEGRRCLNPPSLQSPSVISASVLSGACGGAPRPASVTAVMPPRPNVAMHPGEARMRQRLKRHAMVVATGGQVTPVVDGGPGTDADTAQTAAGTAGPPTAEELAAIDAPPTLRSVI